MPIVGMNFTSITAKLYPDKQIEGNINVNSSPVIEKIEKKDIEMPDMKNLVSITFKFETIYNPKIGEMIFDGEVLYTAENTDKIVAKWGKDKKMEDAMAMEVMNAIFRKCLTKAVDLSAELRLPPPIRFPVVKPKDDNEYTG